MNDPYIPGIYNINGILIPGTTDDDSGVGLNAQVIFTPTSTGDYFVAASYRLPGTGTYQLSAKQTDDFSSDVNTTGTLTPGDTSAGTINFNGDTDWFKISLTTGQIVSFTASHGTLGSPIITGLYDATGALVENGSSANLSYTVATTGNYFVSVGSQTGTGTYQLNVNAFPTGSATATLVSATQKVNYIIKASDLLQGFSDLNQNTLSVIGLKADHGTLHDNQDGTWNFICTDSSVVNLSYTVSDGNGGVIPATQHFTVVSLIGKSTWYGTNQADNFQGSNGNDVLIGGSGADRLTGGAGNDIFKFNALSDLGFGSGKRDVITDFTQGQDKIDLSAIDANPVVAGDQAFSFVNGPFTAAGQVSYSKGIISINADANLSADEQIQLTGSIPLALTASDFIL